MVLCLCGTAIAEVTIRDFCFRRCLAGYSSCHVRDKAIAVGGPLSRGYSSAVLGWDMGAALQLGAALGLSPLIIA
ncbi:MAG: DUF7697 family protein, partial [Lutimaribacter sp.]